MEELSADEVRSLFFLIVTFFLHEKDCIYFALAVY